MPANLTPEYDRAEQRFREAATDDERLEALRELLAVVRVYTKKPGDQADYEKPFTLSVGSTVEDLARQIHRELPETMKYARIWGEGAFSGQHVQRTHVLCDRDVVEMHE